jgi:predicted 3-demethylubiquinone-9 3-methyltransferase (glyoxalase superfamily)
MGLNGGDIYKHSPAFSICLICDSQEEIDRLWDGFITHGGVESQCGWLTDKYGISWQITPQTLIDIYTEGGERAAKTARAMYGMKKLIIKDLVAASRS